MYGLIGSSVPDPVEFPCPCCEGFAYWVRQDPEDERRIFAVCCGCGRLGLRPGGVSAGVHEGVAGQEEG
jgi:hypothetical protein